MLGFWTKVESFCQMLLPFLPTHNLTLRWSKPLPKWAVSLEWGSGMWRFFHTSKLLRRHPSPQSQTRHEYCTERHLHRLHVHANGVPYLWMGNMWTLVFKRSLCMNVSSSPNGTAYRGGPADHSRKGCLPFLPRQSGGLQDHGTSSKTQRWEVAGKVKSQLNLLYPYIHYFAIKWDTILCPVKRYTSSGWSADYLLPRIERKNYWEASKWITIATSHLGDVNWGWRYLFPCQLFMTSQRVVVQR